MPGLTPEQRKSRISLDWKVVQPMNGTVFDAVAYRSTPDLEARRRPITSVEEDQAVKYLVEFRVPTLTGRDKPLQPVTVVGFDLSAGNYPYDEPASWVVGPVPYSPHFKRGWPVCLGELWREAKGRMLFGQLLNHVAMILNWDEEKRGGGYQGWNGDAIKLHAEQYGNRPITPNLRYPALPAELTHGRANTAGIFGSAAGFASQDSGDLFGPAGGAFGSAPAPTAAATDLFSGGWGGR